MIEFNQVINISINILFTIIFVKMFFNIFFVKKPWQSNFLISIIAICVWQIAMIFFAFPTAIIIIISIFLITSFSTQLYYGNVFVKMGFSVIYTTIWVLSEFLVGYAFLLLGIEIATTSICGSILSKGITFMILMIFKYLRFKRDILPYTKKHSWIIIVTPIVSLLLMYLVFYYNLQLQIKADITLSLVLVGILIFANIAILTVYELLIREFKTAERYLRLSQQIKMKKEHDEEIKLMLNNIRKLNHNLKNHFITMRGFLEDNEIEKAINYLHDALDEQSSDNNISNTGNIVIDSIINTKFMKIKKENIFFKTKITIPAILPFMGIDLSILVGSILDNAIDAAEKNTNKENFIHLYIKYECNYLILTCINSFDGTIVRNKVGSILTSKESKSCHGFGLDSVRSICEKYNGYLDIDYDKLKLKYKIRKEV